jgi:hypothetical protein
MPDVTDGRPVGDGQFDRRTVPRFPVRPLRGPVRLANVDGGDFPPSRTLLEGRYGHEVREALDRLRLAFADARLSENFAGCPHCFTESDLRYVRETPLSSFTLDDLASIGSRLVSTLGDADDVPYFLPRLVEAFAQGMLLDIEPVADRIASVPAASWTPERVAALRDAFETLFVIGMRDYEEGGPYGTFADPNSRDYVRAKLAMLPNSSPTDN